MEGKFFQNGSRPCYRLNSEFSVESYLEHQGRSFVQRFDANSYLYLTRAMDYFDAAGAAGGDLASACSAIQARLLLIAYSSDWLYPSKDTRAIAKAMLANEQPVSFIEIPSGYGHDAFLLESEQTTPLLESFLKKV